MAANVLFLTGTESAYQGLQTKDSKTFYLTTGSNGGNLYLGELKLNNDVEDIKTAIESMLSDSSSSLGEMKDALEEMQEQVGDLSDLTGGDFAEAETLVEAINDLYDELLEKINAVDTKVGDLNKLSTSTKTSIVDAINAVAAAAGDTSALQAALKVTLEADEDGDDEYAKVYDIKQGGTSIGKINVPKDMVVSSGRVVTNPDASHTGTFIELTLANDDETKIYINVADLVDVYTAKNDTGAKVVVTIDSSDNTISATIAAGAITETELAATVKASLALADSALQKADITEGTADGTIKVDGTDVKVHGLGSAAYANTSAFDAAGTAETEAAEALKQAKSYADTKASGAETYADGILEQAKAYTDAALTWGTIV